MKHAWNQMMETAQHNNYIYLYMQSWQFWNYARPTTYFRSFSVAICFVLTGERHFFSLLAVYRDLDWVVIQCHTRQN